MSFPYRLAAFAAVSALFTVPASADGVKGKHVNRGPAPLEMQSQHAMQPPRAGCVLVEGNKWSCPVAKSQSTQRSAHKPQVNYAAHSSHQIRSTQSHGAVSGHAHAHQHTHTHAHSHSGNVKRSYTRTQAPTTTRRVVRQSHGAVRQSAHLVLDAASFTGGVGAGVDGGYYGGGGGFISTGGTGGSYVLSHSAAQFTFNRSHGGKRGGRRGHGGKRGGGGCGC